MKARPRISGPAADRAGRVRAAPAPDERRQRILEAALDVIAAGGVDAISHRRVARAAGVPLGSTTYYFDSRAHLIRDAFAAHLARSRELMEWDAGREYAGVDEAVDAIAAIVAREFADRGRLLAEYEMTLFAARDPELARIVASFDTAITNDFSARLLTLGIGDAESAARSILQLIRGHKLDQLVHGRPAIDDLKRRLRILLGALVATGSHPQEDSP
jgi:DNA-binding transcriptional regulator YbjK